jgi:hypothetical protein
MITLTKHRNKVIGSAGQASALSASSLPSAALLPPGAAGRNVAAHVVLLNVGGLSVPVAQQALYDAASEIRLATEAHVGWADCVSAVEIVLAAMERAGVLCFCQSETDTENQEIEDIP